MKPKPLFPYKRTPRAKPGLFTNPVHPGLWKGWAGFCFCGRFGGAGVLHVFCLGVEHLGEGRPPVVSLHFLSIYVFFSFFHFFRAFFWGLKAWVINRTLLCFCFSQNDQTVFPGSHNNQNDFEILPLQSTSIVVYSSGD